MLLYATAAVLWYLNLVIFDRFSRNFAVEFSRWHHNGSNKTRVRREGPMSRPVLGELQDPQKQSNLKITHDSLIKEAQVSEFCF